MNLAFSPIIEIGNSACTLVAIADRGADFVRDRLGDLRHARLHRSRQLLEPRRALFEPACGSTCVEGLRGPP